jgi:hypothetical protein
MRLDMIKADQLRYRTTYKARTSNALVFAGTTALPRSARFLELAACPRVLFVLFPEDGRDAIIAV